MVQEQLEVLDSVPDLLDLEPEVLDLELQELEVQEVLDSVLDMVQEVLDLGLEVLVLLLEELQVLDMGLEEVPGFLFILLKQEELSLVIFMDKQVLFRRFIESNALPNI